MKDCIFCGIVEGRIPAHVVYEDSQTVAFLDIHPRTKGHTVVIPKVHAETIFDLNEEFLKSLLPSVLHTAERIEHVLQPDGYTIGWNHGAAAGQVVPHLHIHIMPRWEGDGGSHIHAIVDHAGDTPVEEVAVLFASK